MNWQDLKMDDQDFRVYIFCDSADVGLYEVKQLSYFKTPYFI